MAASERALETWLVRYCREKGYICLKLGFIVGIPDRLVLLPGGKAVFFELKCAAGRPTEAQKWWINRLTEQGFCATIAKTRTEITQILDEAMK